MAAPDRKKGKIITANWSNLESELLELILKRLAFLDIVHFKAVCSWWNIVARSYITSPIYSPIIPQTPLLMFRKDRIFFNLSDTSFYKITRTERQGRLGFYDYEDSCFVGSSYGWLVIFIKKLKVLHILNPLMSLDQIQIQLPNSSNMSEDIRYIIKAIISCDLCHRSSSKSFCVVVICGRFQDKLGFLVHEDTTTKATTTTATSSITTTTTTTHLVGDGQQIYIDIICHNGMLYALSYMGLVEVWDFHSHPFPKKVLDIEFSPTVTKLINDNAKLAHTTKSCLVESMGELWFVLPIGESVKSMEFAVYKLDYGKKTWVTLENLSNQALFISKNECISVSTRDLPEVRENFIYFVIEYWKKQTKKYRVEIYNFKDKKMVNRPNHMKYCKSTSLLFWIVPNPWIVRSM